MFNKKYIFGSILVIAAIILVMSGCSDKKASKEDVRYKIVNSSDSNVLSVTGDTVSEKNGCVLSSHFTVGDKIVFRMNAVDPSTGKQASKDAKLQLHLSTGETLDMVYGEHPPGGKATFWTVAYPVTKDTPTGALDYYVTAQDGDKKGEFHPFDVAPSKLTIDGPGTASASAQAAPAATEQKSEDTANIQTSQNITVTATNFKFDKDKYYVKAGQEVTLTLKSKEGSHGLMIMGLGQDVAINQPNGTVKFTPTKPGEYEIHCSVFCGEGHGQMTATLVVVA
ncbi:MAG: cupredoxin domain-containing protein [Tuberibacillus sp.]